MPEGYEHPEEFPCWLGREDVDSGKPNKSQWTVMVRQWREGGEVTRWGGCCHPGLAHDTLAGSTDLQDQCQVGPVMLTLIRKLHPPFSAPVLSQGWWGGWGRHGWADLPSAVMETAARSGSSASNPVGRLHSGMLSFPSCLEGPFLRSSIHEAEGQKCLLSTRKVKAVSLNQQEW